MERVFLCAAEDVFVMPHPTRLSPVCVVGMEMLVVPSQLRSEGTGWVLRDWRAVWGLCAPRAGIRRPGEGPSSPLARPGLP
uniref:Macaca fascicularis brain cDNA clone: QflA-20557, similar to human SEC14-like 1 (S. cerevisiae) (SEC14L1), mRNA, RefSeq: NM_003003.1 n=1 Tax=Macaca fascicularis TaxID=9541 RepID=I7G6L4_MACFA|nr:unnamed protein product [Macaca fascicularis]